MANESIKKAFVNGTQTIFTTLFNDGKTDGVNLYLLGDGTKKNIYGENKYKIYQLPKLLVTQARLTPTIGEKDVEGVKDSAVFVVPVKSLQENGLGVTKADLDTMMRGVMEFHGVYYLIDNILPKAYVEDTFLFYHFVCTEDKNCTGIIVASSLLEEMFTGNFKQCDQTELLLVKVDPETDYSSVGKDLDVEMFNVSDFKADRAVTPVAESEGLTIYDERLEEQDLSTDESETYLVGEDLEESETLKSAEKVESIISNALVSDGMSIEQTDNSNYVGMFLNLDTCILNTMCSNGDTTDYAKITTKGTTKTVYITSFGCVTV